MDSCCRKTEVIHLNSPPGYVTLGDGYFSAAMTAATGTRKVKKYLFLHNYAFTQRFDSGTFTKKPKLHFGESFTLKCQ